MKKTMKTALCGAEAMLLLAGVPAQAAVDGKTYRTANGEEWSQTSGYSDLVRGPWAGGSVPADGGTAYFVTPGDTTLKPTEGLQLGAIETRAQANVYLNGRGLTMVGEAPYIQIAYASFLQLNSSAPISGTGANTLTLKTDPGFGFGAAKLYAGLPNFGLLDLESGTIDVYRTGPGQTLLTDGSVRLSGGNLTYVASMPSAGDASASIATGSGSTFTIAPGPARLRVARSTNAAGITLTVGPIVREGRAAAELTTTNDGDNELGAAVVIKTTQAPTLVNGFVEPWLIAKGQNADAEEGAHHVDFLTYDVDKGFVPATALYASDFGDPTDVVNKTASSEVITINADTHVQGLRIVSIGGQPELAINANLTVGDGTHPAAILLNYRGGGNNPFLLRGTGSLDFRTSEGLIWCAPNMTDNRRIVQLYIPIRGSNGITFAGPTQTAGRAPIIQPMSGYGANWTGPLHLRNVRYYGTLQEYLPSPDVYVDGRGSVRSAQVCFKTATLTNHFHISGNGLQDNTDRAGALQGIGTLNGPITLEHDATLFSFADGPGLMTINGNIDGHGTLTLESDTLSSFLLTAANTYDGDTKVVKSLVTLGADGTFGAGAVSLDATSAVKLSGVTKTLPNSFCGDGSVFLSAASLTMTGTSTFGTLAFDGNSQESMAGASTFAATDATVATVTGRGTVSGTKLTVASDSDGECHAALAGSALLVKDGAGTLSLFADATSSGGVTVQGGTLKTIGRLDAPFADSLLFHLDATRADTFKYGEDGAITNWASTVGNVSFRSAGGVFGSPTRAETSWTNLPVVTFCAATSNRLVSSTAIAPRTIFFVVRPRPESMANYSGLFGQADTDHNGIRKSGGVSWDGGSGSSAHHVFDSDGAFIIDGGRSGTHELANNAPQVVVVEKSDTNTNSGRSLSFVAGLGGYCNTATKVAYDRNFDGDIAEVVAYDRILSESERKRVENYLGRKWKGGAFYDGADAVNLGSGALTLAGDGVLDLAGSDVTVASLAGTGIITNSSERAATLTVTGANAFSGEVCGAVTVSVAGGTMAAALSDDASLAVVGNVTLGIYNAQPPTDGLLWWLDAADASTITTNANGEVTGWASRGGAPVSFGVDGSLPKPTYAPVGHANAMGNKPSVWFNGSGRMRLKGDAAKSVMTTFVVWNTHDGTSDSKFRGIYGYLNADAGIRYWTGNGLSICNTSSPFTEVDDYYVDGVRPVLGGNYSISLSVVPVDSIHVLSVVAGSGRTAPSKTYALGSYHGSSERCFIGWLCEVITYDRRLSDAERKQVENYLMAKWQGTGEIMVNATVGGNVTVASGATLTAAVGSPLAVGTLSGAGAISGNVSADGFEVTVKPNGTVDKLTVDGTVTFNAGAHLQVNDFSYLVNGNFETFLDATGNVGTFATSNLEKPYGWTLRNGRGQVYRANGFMLIFR